MRPIGESRVFWVVWILALSLQLTSCLTPEEVVVERSFGDGTLSDKGPESYYPRFVATLDSCVLNGEVCSRMVNGLPTLDYSIHFRLLCSDDSDAEDEYGWDALKQAGISISISLRDPNDGTIIRSFEGRLFENWDSWRSGDVNFYYSPALYDLSISEDFEVLVVGEVEDSSALCDGLKIEVQIHGGGLRI